MARLENDRADGFQLQDTKDASWQGRQKECTVSNGLQTDRVCVLGAGLKLPTPDTTGYMSSLQNVVDKHGHLQSSLFHSRLNPFPAHILELL